MKSTVTFSEFEAASYESWLKAVTKELGEKNIDDLIWKPVSNLTVHPYPGERKKTLSYPDKGENEVHIGANVLYTNDKESNKSILANLSHGANHITVVFQEESAPASFENLFEGVFIEYIRITFKSKKFSGAFIESLSAFLNKTNTPLVRVSLFEADCDKLTKDEINARVQLCLHHTGRIQAFTIDGSDIQNKGADATQVAAYMLLHAEQMIARIENFASKIQALDMIRFHLAIGTNYFLEIAKIESIRLLWNKFAKLFSENKLDNINAYIDTETELLTYAALDVENNILRATTAAMVAMIARVDAHTVIQFDSTVSRKRAFSDRLALNIMHLLTEESQMNRLPNAVKGARYIEQIIEKLAAQILAEIKNKSSLSWEENKQLFFQSAKENHSNQLRLFKEGIIVAIGVNKYPQKNDPDKGLASKISGVNRVSEEIENELSSAQ